MKNQHIKYFHPSIWILSLIFLGVQCNCNQQEDTKPTITPITDEMIQQVESKLQNLYQDKTKPADGDCLPTTLRTLKLGTKEWDINQQSSQGHQWMPLQWAIYLNEPLVVQALLDRGANPNLLAKNQRPALHQAVISKNLAVVETLLKQGADPNILDEEEQTPLHMAAIFGEASIALSLLKNYAEINKQDKELKTPLHWAAIRGHINLVELLLQQGANPNIRDYSGRYPIDWIAFLYPHEIMIMKQLKEKMN